MKLRYIIFSLLIVAFYGCDSDFSGQKVTNINPTISFEKLNYSIDGNAVTINWYSNDKDGNFSKYYFAVSSDTTINESDPELLKSLLDTSVTWFETEDIFTTISMPFSGNLNYYQYPFAVDTIGDSIVFVGDTTKIVDSRFFIYAEDENGGTSPVISRIFGRMNQEPNHAIIKSTRLGLVEEDAYQEALSPIMVLKERTLFWEPIDISWAATDPDGKVVLRYSYSLSYIDSVSSDTLQRVILDSSNGWGSEYTTVEYDSIIYNTGHSGKYTFKVFVMDDANAVSNETATIEFDAFIPTFAKGILIIDSTDDSKFNPNKREGNPDGTKVDSMYTKFLTNAGYTLDDAVLLKQYDYWNVHDNGAPSLSDLIKYRLVIAHSEDRQDPSIDLSFDIGVGKFGSTLVEYLNAGGKFLGIGSYLFTKKASNYSNEVLEYKDDELTADHFGLYSLKKSNKFTKKPTNDYYFNYDFAGVVVDNSMLDLKPMRINPMTVNRYWNYTNSSGSINFNLKDGGTVYVDNTCIVPEEGQVIFKFKSIWDLDTLDYNCDMVYEIINGDTLKHSLKLPNGDENVIHRNGYLGSRYIADNDLFRTVILGMPLFFMDDSDNSVRDNFKALIDWFELDKNPLD